MPSRDDAGGAASLEAAGGGIDIAQAVEIELVVDAIARPAHFRLFGQKAVGAASDLCQWRQLLRQAALAVEKHDAKAVRARAGGSDRAQLASQRNERPLPRAC